MELNLENGSSGAYILSIPVFMGAPTHVSTTRILVLGTKNATKSAY